MIVFRLAGVRFRKPANRASSEKCAIKWMNTPSIEFSVHTTRGLEAQGLLVDFVDHYLGNKLARFLIWLAKLSINKATAVGHV